jgi:hypothetical protein
MSRKLNDLAHIDRGEEKKPDAARNINQGAWHVRPDWADRVPDRSPQPANTGYRAVVLVLVWGATLFMAGMVFDRLVLR